MIETIEELLIKLRRAYTNWGIQHTGGLLDGEDRDAWIKRTRRVVKEQNFQLQWMQHLGFRQAQVRKTVGQALFERHLQHLLTAILMTIMTPEGISMTEWEKVWKPEEGGLGGKSIRRLRDLAAEIFHPDLGVKRKRGNDNRRADLTSIFSADPKTPHPLQHVRDSPNIFFSVADVPIWDNQVKVGWAFPEFCEGFCIFLQVLKKVAIRLCKDLHPDEQGALGKLRQFNEESVEAFVRLYDHMIRILTLTRFRGLAESGQDKELDEIPPFKYSHKMGERAWDSLRAANLRAFHMLASAGRSMSELKLYDQAIALFFAIKSKSDHDPDRILAMMNIATGLGLKGDIQEALTEIDDAFDLLPTDTFWGLRCSVMARQAEILIQLGIRDRAEEIIRDVAVLVQKISDRDRFHCSRIAYHCCEELDLDDLKEEFIEHLYETQQPGWNITRNEAEV